MPAEDLSGPRTSNGRRLRVLVIAYACEPGAGSEPGAGWAFVRAAAAHSDVWVVTRRRFEAAIIAALDADPALAEHLHVTYFDLSDALLARKRSHRDVYWYYPLWQRRLRPSVRQLHVEVGFDLTHHVTFASDWQSSALVALPDVPLVWGPVGGATYQPLRLMHWLGWRGAALEVARSTATRLARRLWADPVARQAALVVAMNADTARRFARARSVVVEPNLAVDTLPLRTARPAAPGGARQAVFVGRLLPWKGARLAIHALTREPAARWTLTIIGDGPDRGHLRTLVDTLGLGDRVTFTGQVPRAQVLAALAGADALLFPSMHDSAGWVVGEAISVGCPVVCLDHGGPPILAGDGGFAVPTRGDVPVELARALLACEQLDDVSSDRWSGSRLVDRTASWYAEVVSQPTA